MTKNMGTVDRGLRIAAAVLIAILYFAKVISGTTAIILLVVAAVLIITSFVGVCPAYLPFKLSTIKK